MHVQLRSFCLAMLALLSFVVLPGSFLAAGEPRRELLWPDGAPGAKGDSEDD